MPVYEYLCKKCGKAFEYKQKMSDQALNFCPEDICSEDERGEVERMISGNVGVLFKGSGFYKTDYATSKPKTPEKPKSCCSGASCGCG